MSSSRIRWTKRSSVNRLREGPGSNKVRPRNREHHAGGHFLQREGCHESGSISRPTPNAARRSGFSQLIGKSGTTRNASFALTVRDPRGDGLPLLQSLL